jgi:hypothetical protein
MKRQKRAKLTHKARATLTAFSLLSFIGGWNVIAHLEKKDNTVSNVNPVPSPTPTTIRPTPTPWATIPPLVDIPPIPTLLPTRTTTGEGLSTEAVQTNDNNVVIQAAPLPTMVPLPTLAPIPELPTPPPPPPPQPLQQAGGNNHSGGS